MRKLKVRSAPDTRRGFLKMAKREKSDRIVHIAVNGVKLEGSLIIPSKACGVVLFAHGSGSSRHSPRNNFVAQSLQSAGIGTLLMDLLTQQEDAIYETRLISIF